MASKRGLYRPAPQENVGQKRNRKPLAQGRLVTGAATNKGGKLVSGRSEGVPAATSTEPHSSHVTSHDQRTPSKLVQGTSHDISRQEQGLTPRQVAPQISEHHSPLQKRPINSLDLSDSELDISHQYRSPGTRVRTQKPAEVLLIDASRQTKDPNQSEVDIAVGFEKSPVRIVCHKPDALEASLRDGGRQVRMDHVTAVSFSEPVIKSQSFKENSPYVAKEKVDHDSFDDNVPILTQIERDMQRQAARRSHYPQPNFNDSQGSEISDIPVRDKPTPELDVDTDDTRSIMSESDACSLHEYVTNSAVKKKKEQSTIKKMPVKTPQTAKKKKTRIVASRYMQGADSKVKASLSIMDKVKASLSIMDKSDKEKNPKASKSLDFARPTSSKSSKKPTRHKVTSAEPKGRPSTPDNSELTDRKTSTPTTDRSFTPQEIDASAIHPEIFVTGDVSKSRTPSKKIKKHSDGTERQDDYYDPFSQSVLSNASALQDSVHHTTAEKHQKPKLTQEQLDLLQARYLQWVFLHSRAKKVREEQEKQAMAQLYGLHEEVEKLRQKKFEKDQDLTRLKHLNQVDEQLDLQRQSLGPVIANLPKLTKEYENLAHALDTTRHQIPTKGIYLPDDEDQYQRQLEQSLCESEQLLGELSVMIRSSVPGVSSMSNALQTMEKAVDTQCTELKRCNQMLAAIQSLTVQETSLEIQALQALDMGSS